MWVGLVLTMVLIVGIFLANRYRRIPLELPVLGRLSDFHLTNQLGAPVALADLRGQVWLAEVIFTRCPGPCVRMTRQWAFLQREWPAEVPVRLVSLTSDPVFDTPAVLQRYAVKYQANSNRWWFLTGPKEDIRHLEINDFKFISTDKPIAERESADDLFIHSTYYVLVDQLGQIRGSIGRDRRLHAYFDSEDPDDITRAIKAIRQLLAAPATAPLPPTTQPPTPTPTPIAPPPTKP